MNFEENHIRHIMIYEYRKGNKATKATRNINEIYKNALSVRKCQRWFDRFQSGNFSIENLPRGRPQTEVEDTALEELVESDPRLTLREMGAKMGCSHEAIRKHLQLLGKVSREGVWIPHQLSDQNRLQRVNIASSLLARNTRELFLHRIVTGDEKWVLYVNVKKKMQWLSDGQQPIPTPKAGLHPKKVMLSIWWDIRGVVHWEVLDPNKTVTADLYCQQLVRLHSEITRNRPSLVNRKCVILQHDNARPHIAKMTQKKIRELGYEILPHPPYSPDISPSDYHLFRSFQHHLSGKVFEDVESIKNEISDFISSKNSDFFKRGIESLVKRWQSIVDNEGDYFID